MTGYNSRLTPLNNIQPAREGSSKPQVKKGSGEAFQAVLEQKLHVPGLKFSQHAQKRISNSNIRLDKGQLRQLEEAVEKARSKAARDALVLMEDLAFVVSVKNNTVITVVDGQRVKENVFTNIDSAVIV